MFTSTASRITHTATRALIATKRGTRDLSASPLIFERTGNTRMRVLVVGGGGREHAFAHALRGRGTEIFVAPGNAGTKSVAHNVDMDATDIGGLLKFVKSEQIDLTVVGPEQPLVGGIVDTFRESQLRIVGPTAAAARLEGSKAFAKDFMRRHAIPTAGYRAFGRGDQNKAERFLRETGAPVVVKASGLAAGKGAIVCSDLEAALLAVDRMLGQRAFGPPATKS